MDEHESMPTLRPPGNRPHRNRARRVRARVAALLAVFAIAAATLRAQEPGHTDEHLHVPLQTSAELTWPVLIRAALDNYPRFVELAARDAEARALVARARSWLSGSPAISARYQTDRPGDDARLREHELGLELPLWRAGEKRAARDVGDAATTESRAAALALRHEVLGLLRMTLWDIERAGNALAVAEDAAATASGLLDVVERLYEAGDLPLTETLLMRSTTLERRAAVIEAGAILVDAERAYRSLTGLTARPASFDELLTERDDIDGSHPWLALADADLARSRAESDLTSREARRAPTLTIGPRRERAPFSDYSADSLGVSITMPFGGRVHVTAATAAADRRIAEAEADRLELLRRLDLDLHEARHGLLVIEESLALARQRSALAGTSFAMSQQAFAQGEMTLLELLRREETAQLTQREVSRLEVERPRAIAQINQAIGVEP